MFTQAALPYLWRLRDTREPLVSPSLLSWSSPVLIPVLCPTLDASVLELRRYLTMRFWADVGLVATLALRGVGDLSRAGDEEAAFFGFASLVGLLADFVDFDFVGMVGLVACLCLCLCLWDFRVGWTPSMLTSQSS